MYEKISFRCVTTSGSGDPIFGPGSPGEPGDGGGGDSGDGNNPNNPPAGGEGDEHGQPEAPPLITSPVVDEDSPCEQLKILSNPTNQNINPEIDFLKAKLLAGVKNEWASDFKTEQLYSGQIVYTNTRSEGTANHTNSQTGWYNIGSAHLHTKNGTPIFSWGDIHSLFKGYESASPGRQSSMTRILICPNPNDLSKPNVYAIKVDNVQALLID